MKDENWDSSQFLTEPERRTILAVEDDPVSLEFIKSQIQDMGHNVISAENGRMACAILRENKTRISAVIMDQMMPVMEGLSAVRELKKDRTKKHIPIVMLTGHSDRADIQSALSAGVFYYLTKPVNETILRSVLSAALREADQNLILDMELKKHKKSFALIENCEFKFNTLEDAENLAAFAANCFPYPENVLQGLGGLLINAHEHGNLGIGYDLKSKLIDQGIWRAEIKKRERQPAFASKYVTVKILRKDQGVYVSIKDMGEGFEWKKYLQIDPARAADNHGRGIAQARAVSFSQLQYNDAGNQVTAFVDHQKPLEW